jgi:type I site-specific restriction endonuclease
METKLTDRKINLKGNFVVREKPKRADYVLYLAPNHPIAIVEAKDNNHILQLKKRVKWKLFYKIVIQLLTKNVICDTINCQQC